MKNLYLLTIAIFLLLCGTSSLHAQGRSRASGNFRIGLSGGATYSVQQSTLDEEDSLHRPLDWEVGFSAGVVAEYRFNDDFSLVSHILYASHPSSLTTKSGANVVIPNPDTSLPPQLVYQVVESREDLRYDLWEFDLLGKARLLKVGEGGLGATLGISLGKVITLELTSVERLVDPVNMEFTDSTGTKIGRERIIVEDMEMPFVSSTRFSARGGIFYDLSLGSLQITPGLYYDFPLTRVFTEEVNPINYTMKAYMLQVDVMMAL